MPVVEHIGATLAFEEVDLPACAEERPRFPCPVGRDLQESIRQA
jgi:hypothetical protein